MTVPSETVERKPRHINTRRLQMHHLVQFMAGEHGCFYDSVGFTDGCFESYSFAQAVKMYNEFEDKDLLGYLIKKVKLQYNKSEKRIVCPSHLVEFTETFKELCDDRPLEEVLVEVLNINRLR